MFSVCDVLIVELGLWVCGKSWLDIKDSLTHRPSSQGWAPGVLLFVLCRVTLSCDVFVIIIVICILEMEVGIYFFLLFTYLGWYAIQNNSMCGRAKGSATQVFSIAVGL